jgi:hypothetical protein
MNWLDHGVSGSEYTFTDTEVSLSVLIGELSGDMKVLSYELNCNTLIIQGLNGNEAAFKSNIY